MSKVILSVPAFLQRIVLASSESFFVAIDAFSITSCADDVAVRREEFERIVDRHGVVQGPAIAGAGRHDLVEDEGDAAGRALHLGQAGIEELARAGDGQFLGHLAGRRDALDDDQHLVRRLVARAAPCRP